MKNQFEPKSKDRSLLYIGITLGIIILIMGYLTFFVDDPNKIFTQRKTLPPPITVKDKTKPLNKSLEMSDEDVRNSLTKFIDAFYYDQNRGYFDPASYFANTTQTYYNYHYLTFSRLHEIHEKRLTSMRHLKQNWIVSSLAFKRDSGLLTTTYGLRMDYYNSSQSKQEVTDAKIEMIVNKEGKIISLRELEKKMISSVSAVEPPDSERAPTISEQDKLYDVSTVGTVPKFPGGAQALTEYLKTNLKYPAEAEANDIEGKVYVGFIVEKDGSLSNLQIINGIDSGCNEEAMRVLRSSPPWQPGIFNGNPVRTAYTLAIPFQLIN